ncbi:alpha/beta fold hydrolase [Streptomyces bambusae]|uniref:thioesterase II family protein n=1 Tax=Streptomyces bambusae TaxID=1550616 RepID=UPI001CFE4C10|nr:alpha/beta fold hydrolase [Streptomyces bambusae]MCB5166110.1 alpha/beta fold hydrolase [Streptomyces bambusae]
MSNGTSAAPAGAAQRWLRGPGGREHTARHRLFVFPHAGAGASSYRLAGHFPETVEVCSVQLPGRENRFAEEPLRSADAVVDALAPLIGDRTDLPYAFFGHSMGALLAYEVTRRLRETGARLPDRLFLSALRAPHLPDRDRRHHLPDAELLALLAGSELGGLDPELQELLLPMVRADLTVCETYEHRPQPPLPVPFTVFGGTADDTVHESELAAWHPYTSAGFELRMFPGDHLYVRSAERQLAESIVHTLPAWGQ